MQLFSIAQVVEITGVHSQTLRNWLAAGMIKPAQAGTTGTGKGHRYSTAQCLAIAAGVRYRDEGAGASRATGVMTYLAGLELEWLEAELAAGNSFPVPAMMLGDEKRPACWLPGMMVKPPDPATMTPGAAALMKRLDLKILLREMKKKIAAMEASEEKCEVS